MGMGQGIRTGLGDGASPVSYRHNFLIRSAILSADYFYLVSYISSDGHF